MSAPLDRDAVRTSLLAQDFNTQVTRIEAVQDGITFNYFQGENIQHPASRIIANTNGVNFRFRGRNWISPFFAVAYAYWGVLRRSVAQQPRDQTITEFMMNLAMRRPNEPDPNYNRLRFRVAVPANIERRLRNNENFSPTALNFLAPHVATILAEENYSDIEMSTYADLISATGVVGRRDSVVVFACEATAFFRRNRREDFTARERVDMRARDLGALGRTRVAGNFGGGGKRKMFYHGKEVQFHSQVEETMTCVHVNPLKEGQFCFPMAFLTSQVRELRFEDGVCSERMSHPLVVADLKKSIDSYPYIVIPYNGNDRIPEFVRGKNLFIFNPIKPSNDLLWESAAKYLHNHVEVALNQSVDHTSWRECPQAYSDAFNVVIHMFIKGFKSRFDVYSPADKKDVVRHIYMYCADEHFNPVIDIRMFTSSKATLPMTWCDYCQKSIGAGALVATKSKHISKCHEKWDFASIGCCDFLDIAKKEAGIPIRKLPDVKEFCKAHEKFECDCDDYSIGNKVSEHVYVCTLCDVRGTYNTFSYKHRCYFKKPEVKAATDASKLFVLDIESLQEATPLNVKYVHDFVLMCVRNIYNEDSRVEYRTMDQFLDDCVNKPEYRDATFIAHNGGGYDYQFIIKSAEKREMEYTFVPRPGSDHKYISLTLQFEDYQINFIDFMCLIPGSLKGIAQSFQLEVQKGDFPHRFLTRETLNYKGPFPPIDSEEDYFSLNWKKSEIDVQEVREWHAVQCSKFCTCTAECECMKPQWDCFQFLTDYCWLDVDVLANACQKYRDLLMNVTGTGGTWNPTPIDPFRYLTQSQLAMQIFLTGFTELPPIGVTIPRRHGINKRQFIWYHRLQQQQPANTFIHYGTNPTRYMWVRDNMYVDCYCVETATVYLFFSTEERELPETEEKIELWSDYVQKGFIGAVEVMYDDNLRDVTELEMNIGNISDDRDFFFGGRTEVLSPYAKPSESEEIKYLDVCSLYPTICSFAMLPIGHPIMYFGSQCELRRLSPSVADSYFGYVRCRVIPNKNDVLGLLPSKLDSGKLVFNLNEKIGMWFTEEIYLAMQCGYVITEIYEVHHFDADNRSDTLMRGYMESFLTLKQESEGWKKLGASSENPTEEEQDRILEELFEANGGIGRAKKENVKKNPVLRQVSKIFLNCLWGKFCQRRKAEFFSELTSYKDYEAVMSTPEVNDMVFRQMSPGRWRVKYTKPDFMLPANPRYNIYLAAGVTAQARCYLHRQMLKIGPERVLYCDTDSIIFLFPKSGPKLTGIGLGQWTDEHPGEVIIDFMAIAPKCYMLNIEGDTVMKAKGCIMSIQNRKILSHETVKNLIQTYCIQKQLESAELKNFSIFTNSTDINYSYGTMFSRYNTKQVRCILNKRQLVETYSPDGVLGVSIMRVTLLPEGFTALIPSPSLPSPHHP